MAPDSPDSEMMTRNNGRIISAQVGTNVGKSSHTDSLLSHTIPPRTEEPVSFCTLRCRNGEMLIEWVEKNVSLGLPPIELPNQSGDAYVKLRGKVIQRIFPK